jgi:hypothetical protein
VVNDQRSTLKGLLVKPTDGLLRLSGIVEFNKGNPARPAAFAIRREMEEHQWTNGREMVP